MNSEERQKVRGYLRSQGIIGAIRVAKQKGDDELVIVLTSSAAAGLDEARITQELQNLINRKVWISTDGVVWEGATEEL